MKILIVCLGNICRSPLAQGVLQQKCEIAGLDVKVESAGTSGYHVGESPHKYAVQVAQENSIDISAYSSTVFKAADFDHFDFIYAMDHNNYLDIKKMSSDKWNESKIDLFLNALYPGKNEEMPDPWYGGYEDFKQVYRLIDEASECIIAKIKQPETLKSTYFH